MTTAPAPALALSVRHLRKNYGGAVALADVSLGVRPGEVHALLGQNGCGKSTLVKSLTGVVVPDSGEVEVFGEPLIMPTTDPHTRGIAVIHQDIGLVEDMTVLENLGANAHYGTSMFGRVDTRAEGAVYTRLMRQLGFEFPLQAKVSRLSPAERALLAIVRAMRLVQNEEGRQLLVLDEPTAALSRPEADRLLTIMRRVADGGSSVVFISHRLAEVMQVCDRATVMRAGRDVLEVPVAETTRSELVAHMLGRRMDDFYPVPPPVAPGAVRLRATGLAGHRISSLDLAVRSGEVVGVTGLAGMGQEELPFLLAGDLAPTAGTVQLADDRPAPTDPAGAQRAGVVLVPGNRLRDGCWLAGTAEENLLLPVLRRHRGRFGLQRNSLRRTSRTLMAEVAVHPDRPELPMSSFSGGNQQKIVFAKWLQLDPEVLLLDEPTQGVDPGAARDLLEMAVQCAVRGAAVVVFSGEHEMLAAICHRVVVLHHGTAVAELSGPDLTERAVLEACESSPSEVSAVATPG